jgi:flavin reductase (DIM6/NTAB) family NADH-FMN oxidoreductase RutF
VFVAACKNMHQNIVALFRQLTLGVYVVGVADGSRRDAFTAASIMQASYEPLILALAINPEHASYPLLQASGSFAVSVLERSQVDYARRFGTASLTQHGADKMLDVRWRHGRSGAPILADALSFFDCTVEQDLPAGDHRIVLGCVVDGAVLQAEGTPLRYADTGNLDNSATLYPHSF